MIRSALLSRAAVAHQECARHRPFARASEAYPSPAEAVGRAAGKGAGRLAGDDCRVDIAILHERHSEVEMSRSKRWIAIASNSMLPDGIGVAAGEEVGVTEIRVHDRRERIEFERPTRLGDRFVEPPSIAKQIEYQWCAVA